MRISGLLIATACAVLVLAGAAPASAWEQEGGMRSLPSGGLMLKDVPSVDPRVNNLPGVNLNPQARDSNSNNCSQKRVSSFDYSPDGSYQTGTMSECSFGNFSITTVRPDPTPWMGSPFNNN